MTLPNRMVMAPLTRNRSAAGFVPWELNALYYRQRASAGLIISEATAVNPYGHGGTNTPGLYTPEQIEGWTLVTNAVHQAGGRIFAQLWHTGRQAPADSLPPGASRQTTESLTADQIAAIIDDYRQAALNARTAGFDGVEIHGANGYLPDQFLEDGTNHRTDEFGGAVENRARFVREITKAAMDAIGDDRVGVRLSPGGNHGGIFDSQPWETFSYAVSALSSLGPAYVHLVQPRSDLNQDTSLTIARFRPLIAAPARLIAAGGFDFASAGAMLRQGDADLIAFGRLFISNPDLPTRLAQGADLNPYDRSTFYGGGPEGYVDYPFLDIG